MPASKGFFTANTKRSFVFSVITLSTLLSGASALLAGRSPTVQERTLDIKAGRNHPLIVKEVRNLKSDKWLRDLEIEVKNITNKPIYYIRLHIGFPSVVLEGERSYGFSLFYGDRSLGQIEQRAGPKDIPINPGETYIFRIPEEKRKGFESYALSKNLTESATRRVELNLLEVNFGDGTGYEYGQPYPRDQNTKNQSSKLNLPVDIYGKPVAQGYVSSIKNSQNHIAIRGAANLVPA